MLMRTRGKPVGRPPKQSRSSPKLNNTTVRDFGGGLNVVDSEQNLTSRFSPVFDNMVTYTDRKVGPRFGYEMWLKLKQGTTTSGSQAVTTALTDQSRKVIINWTAHPFVAGISNQHVTLSGFNTTVGGVTPEMLNRTHGVVFIDANSFSIVVSNSATLTGAGPAATVDWIRDTYMLGGEPIEAKYFSNYILVWTSTGEIFTVDREKNTQRIWSAAIANALPGNPISWTVTEMVALDIFGKELICSNGRDKPLSIDFTRTDKVLYLVDPGNASSNALVPAFNACKSAFRYFTIHDTEAATYPDHLTNIRIAAKDTSMVYSDAPSPADAVDIDMSKITASPEQTVRAFAVIKDALLVITPTATTLMKLGIYTEAGDHDPQPVDTLNGFGSNAPRSVVEIGSDVFMVDFNGVPSARLSTVSNAVVPERVSNYIETMMSKHIGRLLKETMRLHTFGLYDSKNKTVHYYLPKFDASDQRTLTIDPFYFDADMPHNEVTKASLIMRHDGHQLEQGDTVNISGATGFSTLLASDINGERKVVGVLNENYLLVSIGVDLPTLPQDADAVGGGSAVVITPINKGMIGYAYHYVPAQKQFSWSRFKTHKDMIFNCGCQTLEGRTFLFTRDGFMMRYGSQDDPVYGDWVGMYDFVTWTSGQTYTVGQRVFDNVDGLVYICIEDVTTTAASFFDAREAEPDSWEEYKGEPIEFAWELPWADFGNRQVTKSLRFVHIDANGLAKFTLSLFADNIYKDVATGQLMPSRVLDFVPNEAGAFGAGAQTYGAGRRTREQRLWQTPVRFKLLKSRITGSTTASLSISAKSFLYHRGSVVRG